MDDFAEVQSVSVRGGTATVTLDAPTGANATVADSFYAVRGDSTERLEAESVTLEDGEITVRFDNAEFRKLGGEGGRLEIYGEYDTTAYDRVYFDHSVLNADFAADDSATENGDSDEKKGRCSNESADERNGHPSSSPIAESAASVVA